MAKKLAAIFLTLLLCLTTSTKSQYVPEGLVGRWKLTGQSIQRRGTVIDRSGNANAGTVYGSPALSFDGTNDRAEVDTPWNPLIGHRYAWFAVTVKPGAQAADRTLWHDEWPASVIHQVTFRITSDDKLRIFARTETAGVTSPDAISTETITEGVWQSILYAVDLGDDGTVANGFTAHAWVNGVAYTMGAFDADTSQGTFPNEALGWQGIGTNEAQEADFLGEVNWVGIAGKDALPTTADAQAFYDNPQAFFAKNSFDAYWACSEATGTAIDNLEGTAGRDLDASNVSVATRWDVTTNGGNAYLQTGGAGDSFYNAGRWFDGVNDTVVVSDVAALRPGTGEFQIHVWAKCDSTQPNDNGVFVGKGKFGAGEWMLRLNKSGADYLLSFYGDAGDISATSSGTNYADDALHLFSVIRTGSSVRIYVDADPTPLATDSSASDDLPDAADLEIGSTNSEIGRCIAADIYEVIYTKKTMSLAAGRAEMAAIYASSNYR